LKLPLGLDTWRQANDGIIVVPLVQPAYDGAKIHLKRT
jgi:hypothetical protein